MPLWPAAYFALYVAFSLWAIHDDIRNKEEPILHTAVEVVSDALLLLSALSYWVSEVRALMVGSGLFAFSIGVAGLSMLLGRSIQKHAFDPSLSLQGKIAVAASGSVLSGLFGAPLLYWGYQSAVLHSHAGA